MLLRNWHWCWEPSVQLGACQFWILVNVFHILFSQITDEEMLLRILKSFAEKMQFITLNLVKLSSQSGSSHRKAKWVLLPLSIFRNFCRKTILPAFQSYWAYGCLLSVADWLSTEFSATCAIVYWVNNKKISIY